MKLFEVEEEGNESLWLVLSPTSSKAQEAVEKKLKEEPDNEFDEELTLITEEIRDFEDSTQEISTGDEVLEVKILAHLSFGCPTLYTTTY